MGVHEELKNMPNTLNLNQTILPESTSPKTYYKSVLIVFY